MHNLYTTSKISTQPVYLLTYVCSYIQTCINTKVLIAQSKQQSIQFEGIVAIVVVLDSVPCFAYSRAEQIYAFLVEVLFISKALKHVRKTASLH